LLTYAGFMPYKYIKTRAMTPTKQREKNEQQ
jgi:hypothetical protein